MEKNNEKHPASTTKQKECKEQGQKRSPMAINESSIAPIIQHESSKRTQNHPTLSRGIMVRKKSKELVKTDHLHVQHRRQNRVRPTKPTRSIKPLYRRTRPTPKITDQTDQKSTKLTKNAYDQPKPTKPSENG